MNNLNLITALEQAIEAMDDANEKIRKAYNAAGYSYYRENKPNRLRQAVAHDLSGVLEESREATDKLERLLGNVQKDTANRISAQAEVPA